MTTRWTPLVVSIPILTLITTALLIAEDATGNSGLLLAAYASLVVLAIVGGLVVWLSFQLDAILDDDMVLSDDDLERVLNTNAPSALTAKELIERHAPVAPTTPEPVVQAAIAEPEPKQTQPPAQEIVLSPSTEVFVNLGRRNKQLNRQMLTLIAHLERDEVDPDTLQGLYELDHLATRMRRHEETLLMLTSTRRVRQWSPPVRLEDVLRSSLAEVERFSRVELGDVPDVEVLGSVAPDLTHLLAELIDNATEFSHTSTLVTVSAHTTLEGVEIEVLDSGHGIDETKREALNDLLANPPSVNDAPARRLGLFVVAQIAQGLDVGVELTGERGVGTVASVSVGHDLVVETESPDEDHVEALEAIDLLDPVLQVAVGSELAEHEEDELASAFLPTDQEVADAMATFPTVEILDTTPAFIEPDEATVFPSIADIPEPAAEALPSRIPQATFESVWETDDLQPMPAADVSPLPPVEFQDAAAEDRAADAASAISAFSAGIARGMLEAEEELSEERPSSGEER